MAGQLSRRALLVAGCVTLVIGFVVGILIGRFATCPPSSSPPPTEPGVFLPGVPATLVSDGDPAIADLIRDGIDNRRMKENLRELSRLPHVAGSPREHELARMLRQFWVEAGLDDVTMRPYDVMLSYPDPDDPSYVKLLDARGQVLYQSPATEAILTPEENVSDVLPPFNAYSPPGNVQGAMVYVNYGRVEDYDVLRNLSINVTGKIVIARYGKIFRGSKVTIAQRQGAVGVILYSDPADYAVGDNPDVYPNNWWLPPSGAQRGNVLIKKGDPMTPGYPSTGTAYRYNDSEIDFLPRIPCHPIGYGIARTLLLSMGGAQAPEHWQGGLSLTYRLGPGLQNNLTGGSVQLHVSTTNQRRVIYNVIGIIRGSVEPDRYVMYGNHRDAWVFGAIDPSSGTAAMMEVSRVMGELVKSGRWRPRRSIMFCSWGAEEYGLLGSTEYAEEYIKNLQNRAVAYINVDSALSGNYTLSAEASPMMYKVLIEATKRTPNPDPDDVAAGKTTVFDKWLATTPDPNLRTRPKIPDLGSGSDFAPLMYLAGVSGVNLDYLYNTVQYPISSYPLYHSVYETFYTIEKFFDRNFEVHRATARVSAEMARRLADSLILPLSVSDYAYRLQQQTNSLLQAYSDVMRRHNIHVEDLNATVNNFTTTAREFEERVASINTNHPLIVRMVNDQLMLFDKTFLDPNGLPLRSHYKHLIFAPSSNDHYASSSFPGLSDLLFEIDLDPDKQARWERVKHHFSVILFTIQSAASTLLDVTKFVSDHL